MKNIFDLDIMNKADNLYHRGGAYAALKQNTIASNRIQILEKMASGQFGIVYKGWSIFTSSEIENEWKNRQALKPNYSTGNYGVPAGFPCKNHRKNPCILRRNPVISP